MAKLIDKEPKYEGEKKVWHAFMTNLPQQWVVYNTRSVNGREYDFCVMSPEFGLCIVEVKGWYRNDILTVADKNTIFLAGEEEPDDSPRGQARGYRFDLLKKINRELGMNPLVMSMVCYPCLSQDEYYDSGLQIVSEVNETIFKEDLEDSAKLFQKFKDRYDVDKGVEHDDMSAKRFALLRHHFEPNYDLKQDLEELNPGYSRLRVIPGELSDACITEIVEEYFKGIKEIVFVDDIEKLKSIILAADKHFQAKKISPYKNGLVVGYKEQDFSEIKNDYMIFNFEVHVVEGLKDLINESLTIEEGQISESEKEILVALSDRSGFNFQQYEIEHAPSDKNLLVMAGAGTGKTFSMVSRIAYLCNRTTDAVVDIVSDIAMITFTKDAAENMNSRVKKMFMNYFVLTSNEKYMHLIEDMNQIHISTIHKFAISLLQKDCMRLGIGYDSQISSETYNRRQLYHKYLNDYLIEKEEENPNFVQQLIMPTYDLEKLLISFCDKLYDRSVDIKKLEIDDFGAPVPSMPYFNELIEKVILCAEREYAQQLKDNDLIGLKECMIQIHDLAVKGKLIKQGNHYKYLFVDEFQDTDDVQIETITELQKLFGEQCHLFVVGDLKQSIYRFRGATLSAFDKVTKVNGIGEWRYYSLNRNYRTDNRLLDQFHIVFNAMGESGILPYTAKDDRLTSLITKEYQDDFLVRKIDIQSKNQQDYYKKLFDEVKVQIEELKKISQKTKLSAEEKTIAILVRYNWQIVNILKEAEQADVHVKVTEGGDLYRLPSTMDLYKLTLALIHPRNKEYLINLIKSNYVAVNMNYVLLSGLDESKKLDELVKILDEYFMLMLGKKWADLVLGFQTRPVLVVLREIYDSTKPWVHFSDKEDQESYRTNYECLIEKIVSKFSREYMTLNKVNEFLKINVTTYQEEASRSKTGESEEIKVICTTIHKSKGLEYGTVILPFTNEDISNINKGGLNVNIINGKVSYGISQGSHGSDYSSGFDQETEQEEKVCEESRILYVALTRAIRNFVWFNDIDTDYEDSWGSCLEVVE